MADGTELLLEAHVPSDTSVSPPAGWALPTVCTSHTLGPPGRDLGGRHGQVVLGSGPALPLASSVSLNCFVGLAFLPEAERITLTAVGRGPTLPWGCLFCAFPDSIARLHPAGWPLDVHPMLNNLPR